MEKESNHQHNNREISDQAFKQNGYNLFSTYLDELKDVRITKLEEWAMGQVAA